MRASVFIIHHPGAASDMPSNMDWRCNALFLASYAFRAKTDEICGRYGRLAKHVSLTHNPAASHSSTAFTALQLYSYTAHLHTEATSPLTDTNEAYSNNIFGVCSNMSEC